MATRFGRNNGLIRFYVRRLVKRNQLTPEEGARTVIYLATSPEVEGMTGNYYIDNQPARSSESSHDPALAKRLWQVSLELTGLDDSTEPPATVAPAQVEYRGS